LGVSESTAMYSPKCVDTKQCLGIYG
jgi:hypothetical protein